MWNVAQTRPQDWAYLAEGGSTVVFSYAGPAHPHFTGKILRLRKTSTSRHTGDEGDDTVAFQNTVIAALVPSQFLPDLESVHLDATWLATLEALQSGDRPPQWRAKDQIDKTRQKGILATDLVRGQDVLAIEIKPKWGFLPNTAHLSQETAEVKTSTCRFCMHAHFKFKDGDVPTQYCPLDLYSQDESRMRKAIRDLWDGWVQSNGALNNMKVFMSGKTINPSEARSFLGEFLSAGIEVHEALATALIPLLRTPALRTISNLQRSLDALDIEGIVKLHVMACPDDKDLGATRKNPSLKELQDFVASYHSVYCSLDHSKPCPENMDTYLTAYLLSATFKDCSVICRIPRSDMSGNPSVDAPHPISIIDLDFKGVDRLERWADLDRRIVEHYRDVVQRSTSPHDPETRPAMTENMVSIYPKLQNVWSYLWKRDKFIPGIGSFHESDLQEYYDITGSGSSDWVGTDVDALVNFAHSLDPNVPTNGSPGPASAAPSLLSNICCRNANGPVVVEIRVQAQGIIISVN
ncbi:Inositol-pentakisphosphate 2-kinase domain containing protein [Tylopilus felleus]